MSLTDFRTLFVDLTALTPFPWQEALFVRLLDRKDLPDAADIPTGLGKTSVVTIWLIALLLFPEKVARRLVYVVNRRTVVDQTTAEVERLREKLRQNPKLSAKLQALCAVPSEEPLALSTLRGQFADNREWSADPARPAVIVGTVDMIGSALLFNRYNCGFKLRPHHAAFLGQDVLLVHDEAHLEPAFQTLLESIVNEQKRSADFQHLHVLQLTATARGAATAFALTSADEANEEVSLRLKAQKHLQLTAIENEKPAILAAKLAESALAYRKPGRAVMIFARSVETVQKVATLLKGRPYEVLTGTMRGKERESLIRKGVFARFLPSTSRPDNSEFPPSDTCYLVSTSAGEVGVNLSADDLVCDLSTYESMAQRFGRVNRFGKTPDATIEIIYPETFESSNSIDAARERTLNLMRQLNGDASPDALRRLSAEARAEAFAPPPKIRRATDILFDAWAMTTLPWAFRHSSQPVPGCPPVAPYLHGEEEWQPPETYVAWRQEVELISEDLMENYPPEELLSEYPLKPHELLRDRSTRVRSELDQMVKRLGESEARCMRVWLIANDGSVNIRFLADLAATDSQAELESRILLLPPKAGGLSPAGLLEGTAEAPDDPKLLDVADIFLGPNNQPVRMRCFADTTEIPENAESEAKLLRVKMLIDTQIKKDDFSESKEDQLAMKRYWLWLEAPIASGSDSTRSKSSVALERHASDVANHARNIVRKLALSASLSHSVILAAKIHDLGKRRLLWQKGIGNFDKTIWLAKSGHSMRQRSGIESYRHEFGSLVDVEASHRLQQQEIEMQKELGALSPEEKDIVLHLVAAHHGRARPIFPVDECFDPDASYDDVQNIAAMVPTRFARLQRRFGRWGLAYIESLLRSADYAASAEIAPLTTDSNE